jgi:hypothetical protein
MKHLHRWRQWMPVFVGIAIAVIVSSRWVSADPGPSVSVKFDVQSMGLSKEWGATAMAGVIGDVQKALAAKLKERLPHWAYAPVDPASTMPGAQLTFAIAETKTGALVLRVSLRTPNDTTPALTANWLASHDIMLTGYPPSSTAAETITADISARIFDPYNTDIRGWLSKHVPIAIGAHWMGQGGPPRLVLSLPWARYDALRASVFLLDCEWPMQGTAILESVGPGLAAPYAPPPPTLPPNPPFDGVVVIAREREHAGQRRPVDQIGPELFELKPKSIYLKEYRPASDWNVGGQP